jgi:hypothetical protein
MVEISKLREFVKENLKLLLSEQDNSRALKELKKRKFVKEWKKKFGVPTDGEILKEAILILIKIRKVESLEKLEKLVETLPTIKHKAGDLSAYSAYLTDKKSIIDETDIRELQTTEVKEKIVGGIINEAKKDARKIRNEAHLEASKELKKIENEKSELESIRKQIEDLEIKPEQIGEQLEQFVDSTDEKTIRIWWEQLGLVGDPFPGENKGLSPAIDNRFSDSPETGDEIRNQFFNDVLIRTKLFNEFAFKIEKYPQEFLTNTFLVLGEFGSGKSVFFEFIEKELYKNGFLPIPIWIDTKSDIESMFNQFYRSILSSKNLRKRYMETVGTDLRSRIKNNDKEEVCYVISEIESVRPLNGVVFIIDGLHKYDDAEGTANSIRFIERLQNFSDMIYNEGIHYSIFIAGTPKWFEFLKNKGSLSGSLTKSNILPLEEVGVASAYEMFNKRFKNFSRDKEKPVHVPKKNVEIIYSRLKGRLTRQLGFRDYIDELMPSLKNGNIKDVVINPLYSTDIIGSIFLELQTYENGALLAKLNNLKEYFSSKPQNALKILNFLLAVFDYGFIPSDDPFYKSNKNFFGLLLNFGLLKEATSSGKVGVTVSKDLKSFNDTIQRTFGYRFSEVVLELAKSKILALDKLDDASAAPPEEIRILENILLQNPEWKPRFKPYISNAISLHEVILETQIPDYSTVLNAEESLKCLLNMVFEALDASSSENNSFEYLHSRITHPKFQELFNDIRDYAPASYKIQQLKSQGNASDDKEYSELFYDYRRAYISICKAINELVKGHNAMSLNRTYLSESDIGKLYLIRKMFVEKNLSRCVELLSEYYEELMRCYLYNLLRLKYGEKYKRRFGKDINDRIFNNLEKGKRSTLIQEENRNCLYHCDRADYEKITLGDDKSRANWNQIFSPILPFPKARERYAIFFSDLHPFITGEAHNWDKITWEKNIDKLRSIMNQLTELVERFNYSYVLLLRPNNIHVIQEGESKRIYFSFYPKLEDKDHLVPVDLDNNVMEKVLVKIFKKLENSETISFAINDDISLSQEFGLQYREIVASVAYAIKNHKLSMKLINGVYILGKYSSEEQ